MDIDKISFLADVLIIFTYGNYEAIQTVLGSVLPLGLPSLAAMVLTTVGHLKVRDLVAIFSLPGIAATFLGIIFLSGMMLIYTLYYLFLDRHI